MDGIAFGVRESIFLLLAGALIYLLVLLLKFVQIGRSRPASTVMQEPELARPLPQPAAEAAESEGAAAEKASPAAEWTDVRALFGSMEPAGEQPVAASPGETRAAAAKPGGFGEHLAEHLARSEMEQEIQRMRTEIEDLRAELEDLRVAQRVSPQYAEAMELAQRGLSAQAVADHLDISLAEAELVQALSRGDRNFKEEDEHGADLYAADDGNKPFDNRRGD